jgi:hypothetical protein
MARIARGQKQNLKQKNCEITFICWDSNTGHGGIVKQENTPTEWDKPWPNTPSEEMLKFLCRIR